MWNGTLNDLFHALYTDHNKYWGNLPVMFSYFSFQLISVDHSKTERQNLIKKILYTVLKTKLVLHLDFLMSSEILSWARCTLITFNRTFEIVWNSAWCLQQGTKLSSEQSLPMTLKYAENYPEWHWQSSDTVGIM